MVILPALKRRPLCQQRYQLQQCICHTCRRNLHPVKINNAEDTQHSSPDPTCAKPLPTIWCKAITYPHETWELVLFHAWARQGLMSGAHLAGRCWQAEGLLAGSQVPPMHPLPSSSAEQHSTPLLQGHDCTSAPAHFTQACIQTRV